MSQQEHPSDAFQKLNLSATTPPSNPQPVVELDSDSEDEDFDPNADPDSASDDDSECMDEGDHTLDAEISDLSQEADDTADSSYIPDLSQDAQAGDVSEEVIRLSDFKPGGAQRQEIDTELAGLREERAGATVHTPAAQQALDQQDREAGLFRPRHGIPGVDTGINFSSHAEDTWKRLVQNSHQYLPGHEQRDAEDTEMHE
ncbi:hypothetical protein OC845_005490 [Tilletia horrida]|nr:hypothetical protein OC845_005490 [Tilletia horrida]